MDEYYREVRNILAIILVLNVLVAAIKILYGYHANILSITSDGFDSLFDGVSNIVGIIAIYMASKPSDSEHRYGHAKIETFSAIIIAVLLFTVAIEVITAAIGRFNGTEIPQVTLNSFIILIATLLINMGVSWYERKKGEELHSDILISDSQHTKSDIFATSIILVGLVFIHIGYPIVDPILSIFVALIIIKTGLEILFDNLNILLDRQLLTDDEIKSVLCDIQVIDDIHNIRTRGTPSQIYLDMHIVVNGDMSLEKSHDIAHNCESKIKEQYPNVIDVLIHVEPHKGLEDKIVYED
ncbi:MAG: cation diffusion facilitator family transporter [Methanosphaera sp.]|nr:cation diffusion facilitator family transporter [Methanosphaera sp.]